MPLLDVPALDRTKRREILRRTYRLLGDKFPSGKPALAQAKKNLESFLMVMVSSSLFVTLLIVFFSGYHTCGVVGMAPVLRNSLFRAALSSSLLGRAGKIP